MKPKVYIGATIVSYLVARPVATGNSGSSETTPGMVMRGGPTLSCLLQLVWDEAAVTESKSGSGRKSSLLEPCRRKEVDELAEASWRLAFAQEGGSGCYAYRVRCRLRNGLLVDLELSAHK